MERVAGDNPSYSIHLFVVHILAHSENMYDQKQNNCQQGSPMGAKPNAGHSCGLENFPSCQCSRRRYICFAETTEIFSSQP